MVQPDCAGGKTVGRLVRADTSAGYSRIECYDDFGRPYQQRVKQGGETFANTVEYDGLSL